MLEPAVSTEIPEPTSEKAGSIKKVSKDTVHKICSGQVVLSLAVAVKELLENAIDAGATLVEVKLREQGLESLEVSDNGSGVEERNLEGMTAKYHTSKIREFVDLQGVETFGFRGEALSSLCALSNMTVTTRHRSTDVGTKIELDNEGRIKKRTQCARPIGTTVTLADLFGTLPVRRRDFTRNVKKEFAKMCQILQAYCLAAKGVRIICSNQSAKGNKTVVMQTHGAQDVMANITAVFGSRQTAEIMPLKSPFDEENEQRLTAESLRADLQDDVDGTIQFTSEDVERINAGQFKLEGYVSSCSHAAGRSSKDRQYFYVNSRPCDSKNISKMVNDIYHRYNVHQYPFVYLDVITARADVDVNLTPDKRQLLINNEKILLLVIKRALTKTYGQIPSTYNIQNSTILSMLGPVTKCEEEGQGNETQDAADKDILPISSSQRFMDVLSQWKRTGDTAGLAPHVPAKRKCVEEIEVRTMKLKKIQEYLTKETASDSYVSYKSDSDTDADADRGSESATKCGETEADACDNIKVKETAKLSETLLDVVKIRKESAEYDALTEKKSRSAEAVTVERIDCKTLTPAKPRKSFVSVSALDAKETYVKSALVTTASDSEEECSRDGATSPLEFTKTIELDDSPSKDESLMSTSYTLGTIRTTLAEIEQKTLAEEQYRKKTCMKATLERLRFKSEINPSQNANAEAELQKEISKESFAQMDIIGQFNLGFIIVKLDADLFIVDQHATDEKYNFEMLQRTTVLQNQPLTVPQTLEMTAVNEMVLLDHLAVFEKNGFKFEINEQAPPTRKVRLLAKPFSQNWEFGKEDIDELIFMLQDAPEGTICRPSRVRSMFASRACRKSVMIGKALNKAAMRQLITHMGEIEQPWNCPHGRPTMRHLINIGMLDEDEEDTKEQ